MGYIALGSGMNGKLVIGNWKMNGTLASNAPLLAALAAGWRSSPQTELVVCPPAAYLGQARLALQASAVSWGAQDVSDQAAGAFTGELGAAMLRDMGCRYVLVGHSERRTRLGETDQMVAAKARAALSGGLRAVVCMGETEKQRAAGQALTVLRHQLQVVLAALPRTAIDHFVIAYEPLWAIGTGAHASADIAQQVHSALRAALVEALGAAGTGVRILYGGSVKASNAAEYAAQRDVDGVLVGGASLQAAEFLEIGAAFLPIR